MRTVSITATIGKAPSCEPIDYSRHEQYPLWMWWNLLSLDAPTIVFVWAVFFIKALEIPIRVWEMAALTFAVWIIYVCDRMLDALLKPRLADVSDRHHFYSRHIRSIFGALPAIFLASAWILAKLNDQTRWAGLAMCAIVFFYFLAIHGASDRPDHWFPKEIAVGGIFAVGAALPAWIHGHASRNILLPEIFLFAAQCALNCIAIECWEHNRGERRWGRSPYWLIRLADTHIAKIAATLIMCTSLIDIFVSRNARQADLLGASAISLLAIMTIEWSSDTLSPRALRVLADAALLTPVIFLIKWAM